MDKRVFFLDDVLEYLEFHDLQDSYITDKLKKESIKGILTFDQLNSILPNPSILNEFNLADASFLNKYRGRSNPINTDEEFKILDNLYLSTSTNIIHYVKRFCTKINLSQSLFQDNIEKRKKLLEELTVLS